MTIYVRLLDEGVDCWRPVTAERVRDDIYRIVGAAPDPEDEKWEFFVGQLVRCNWQELIDGTSRKRCLVANEAAT